MSLLHRVIRRRWDRVSEQGPEAPRRSRLPGLAVVFVIAAGLLFGCATRTPAPVSGWDEEAPVPEGYYRVRSGDTLSEVAERLKLSVANLAKWNHLEPPYKIRAGGLLRVLPPGGGEGPVPEVKTAAGGASAGKTQAGRVKAAPVVRPPAVANSEDGARTSASGLAWQWPLKGPVKRRFAPGDRTRSGIRIGGRPGATVVAAEAGDVVYSGSGLKGYGNLIIVKHNKNYLSAYGFNRRLLVREGDHVKRGQAVAEVGQAGGDWLLHFEIRKNGTAVDPMGYLPKSR